MIAFGLGAAACTPTEMAEPSGSRIAVSQQAADAALAAFGRNNQACRMWTNWQKLCSRTGPGMTTACKADSGFPVEPSEAFCVSREVPVGTTNQAQYDTPAQRRSRNRFCDFLVGAGGSMREQVGSMPECELYVADRPFDGRRAEAVAHPLCRQWKPSASDVGTQFCAAWADDLPCPRLIGNAYRHPDNSTLVMPTVRISRSQAVWGVYCY